MDSEAYSSRPGCTCRSFWDSLQRLRSRPTATLTSAAAFGPVMDLDNQHSTTAGSGASVVFPSRCGTTPSGRGPTPQHDACPAASAELLQLIQSRASTMTALASSLAVHRGRRKVTCGDFRYWQAPYCRFVPTGLRVSQVYFVRRVRYNLKCSYWSRRLDIRRRHSGPTCVPCCISSVSTLSSVGCFQRQTISMCGLRVIVALSRRSS